MTLNMQILKNCYNIICSYITDFSILLFEIYTSQKQRKKFVPLHTKKEKIK